MIDSIGSVGEWLREGVGERAGEWGGMGVSNGWRWWGARVGYVLFVVVVVVLWVCLCVVLLMFDFVVCVGLTSHIV